MACETLNKTFNLLVINPCERKKTFNLTIEIRSFINTLAK